MLHMVPSEDGHIKCCLGDTAASALGSVNRSHEYTSSMFAKAKQTQCSSEDTPVRPVDTAFRGDGLELLRVI